MRANGHKSLVAQQSLRETALGTAHGGKSLPCESAFNKNVFLVILPSVLVMTSDPSQMTEVLLKACACPSPRGPWALKGLLCLLPEMVLRGPRVARVPALCPGVADKAPDKREDTPAGQVPGLQVTWRWVQGDDPCNWQQKCNATELTSGE